MEVLAQRAALWPSQEMKDLPEQGGPGFPLQLEGNWLLPSASEIEGLGFQPQQLNTTFPFLSQPQRNARSCEACWGCLACFVSLSYMKARKRPK